MRIFEIEFTIAEKVNLPENIELPEEVDRDDIWNDVERVIHLGATCFDEALEEASFAIEEVFRDEDGKPLEYEITGVRALDSIDVLNWPGEYEECDCPYCKAKRVAEEDVMKIECPNCEAILRVADNGWESILCTECKQEILRDALLQLGQNYKVIHIGKDDDSLQ